MKQCHCWGHGSPLPLLMPTCPGAHQEAEAKPRPVPGTGPRLALPIYPATLDVAVTPSTAQVPVRSPEKEQGHL